MFATFFHYLRRGYLLIPLGRTLMSVLDRVAYRKTRLLPGQKTETHRHRWFSFYVVEKMKALQTTGDDLPLPKRAMVIVLPFVLHGWTNQAGTERDTFVYDLSPLHGPHQLVA
jgi:hypothetical protein